MSGTREPWNPYLQAFLDPLSEAEVTRSRGSALLASFWRRHRLTRQYAWAVPTDAVVREIASLSPICDLGCGTGYWARLLRDAGADVVAVDRSPPAVEQNHWHPRKARCPDSGQVLSDLQHFVEIVRDDAATFRVPADHTLLLCWPPYATDMASVALSRYPGRRVVYVGEGEGGCTGDDVFHADLRSGWSLAAEYEIPQWEGVHDQVQVFERRQAP